MRRFFIITFAIAIAAYAQPQSSAVLSQSQVQQLEVSIAQHPGDSAAQTLLGKNYAYSILGITSLGQFDRIEAIDPAEPSGDFASHAREQLLLTPLATVVAEGGQALWQHAIGAQAYQTLHHLPATIDTKAAQILGVQCLDRAISLDPDNPRWRSYRIPILVFRANFRTVLPLSAGEAYAQVKQDLSVLTGSARYAMLPNAAKLAVKASAWEDGRSYARDLLKSSTDPKNWNYGNAIFFANSVLGQIALRQDKDVEAAKRYLLAAGKTPGSPQLNSFGPNLSLAKDLLEAGERETVLTFFEECRAFWKMDRGKLKQWADEVSANRVPEFGANLVY